MRKRIALLLIIILVLPMMLTACGGFSKDDLIGTWEPQGMVDNTLCFYSDGTGLYPREGKQLNMTWQLNENILTLCVSYRNEDRYSAVTIIDLTDKQLVIETEDGRQGTCYRK